MGGSAAEPSTLTSRRRPVVRHPATGLEREGLGLDHITPSRALALVGPGRAGTSLALALHRRGWSVRAFAGRAPDAASTRRAVALLGDARAVKPEWAGRGCDLVIVATPDHSVAAA